MRFWMRRLAAAVLLGAAIAGIELAGARGAHVAVVIGIASGAAGMVLLVSAVQWARAVAVRALRARRPRVHRAEPLGALVPLES